MIFRLIFWFLNINSQLRGGKRKRAVVYISITFHRAYYIFCYSAFYINIKWATRLRRQKKNSQYQWNELYFRSKCDNDQHGRHSHTHKLSCTLLKALPKVSLIIFNLKLDSEHRILFECAIHLKKDTHTHTQWTLKHTRHRLNCAEISLIDFNTCSIFMPLYSL